MKAGAVPRGFATPKLRAAFQPQRRTVRRGEVRLAITHSEQVVHGLLGNTRLLATQPLAQRLGLRALLNAVRRVLRAGGHSVQQQRSGCDDGGRGQAEHSHGCNLYTLRRFGTAPAWARCG